MGFDMRLRSLAANLALVVYAILAALIYGHEDKFILYTLIMYGLMLIAAAGILRQSKITSQKSRYIFASLWSKVHFYLFGGFALFVPLKIPHLISVEIAHPFITAGFEIVSGLLVFIALCVNALIVPVLTATYLWGLIVRPSDEMPLEGKDILN
jgi:hypothetical protein